MWTIRVSRTALACAVMSLSVPGARAAFAQDSATCACTRTPPHEKGPPSEFALRSSGDFSLIQSRPAGQFGDNIGLGYGLNAAYLFRLDQRGIISLRTDVGFADYGDQSTRVPFGTGRVQVKVSTNNYIIPVSIGPQLTWPRGAVRPYVNAGFGEQFFVTESSVGDGENQSGFSTTNQHDHTKSWVAGGGVYVPVRSRKVDVMLDAGVQYFMGGHAQYLGPNSITDLPNDQLLISPFESDTHMFVVRLGVRLGFGT